MLYPSSRDEVSAAVQLCRDENRTLRVIGNQASQVPFASSQDLIISLKHMNRILDFDVETGVVHF